MSANDALLLIGHGSERYPEAASAMCRYADSLRHEKRFAHVAVGLLNGTPSVTQALAGIDTANIRVVPFFMEDGYFTRVAVPRALGCRLLRDEPDGQGGKAGHDTEAWAVPQLPILAPAGDRRILFCPPVGTHDGMAGLIERQALAACATLGVPSRSAAILVVGHGSSSTPGQALALHRHSARVAATELFVRVESACLEEAPFVAGALSGLRAHPVVVIGFFAGEGGHVRDDLPALIAAERAARGEAGLAVRFHGSVTGDPAMTEIILDQATSDPRGE